MPILKISRSHDEAHHLVSSTCEDAGTGVGCTVANKIDCRTADPQSEHWKTRDLAAHARGTDTPTSSVPPGRG